MVSTKVTRNFVGKQKAANWEENSDKLEIVGKLEGN